MYKPIDKLQHSFLDFNQPLGLHMKPDNRWIKLADQIPWDTFEAKYAELFPSDTGNVAKPLRMALGALIIQTKFQYSDRELVEQITENPYLQYFIGLPGFREEAPFDATCAPANIRYPQDISLLNETREKLENTIYHFANVMVLSCQEDIANVPEKSISQPWLRPIVRGKVKAPVEFGAKFDLSLDSEGYGRIEKYLSRHTTRAPSA